MAIRNEDFDLLITEIGERVAVDFLTYDQVRARALVILHQRLPHVFPAPPAPPAPPAQPPVPQAPAQAAGT